MAEVKEEKKEENKLKEIKVLFLDVDGVLNTYDTITRADTVDKEIILRLAKIIDATNCKIVLSSTWRNDEGAKDSLFKQMREMADINAYNDLNGKKGNVYIGDTEDLDPWFDKNANGIRTEEIMDYLENCKDKYIVTNWCAVDDMKLGRNTKARIILKFVEHFCQTDGNHGITHGKMKEIIAILNK